MRVLGFSRRWQKLSDPEFTTFRFPRKDRDWQVGEEAKVVFKPRRKGGGELLGTAKIINKKATLIRLITEEEAIADGFHNTSEIWHWLKKPPMYKEINKLTLGWIDWEQPHPEELGKID